MKYDIPFPFMGRGRATVVTPAARPSSFTPSTPITRTILTYGGVSLRKSLVQIEGRKIICA